MRLCTGTIPAATVAVSANGECHARGRRAPESIGGVQGHLHQAAAHRFQRPHRRPPSISAPLRHRCQRSDCVQGAGDIWAPGSARRSSTGRACRSSCRSGAGAALRRARQQAWCLRLPCATGHRQWSCAHRRQQHLQQRGGRLCQRVRATRHIGQRPDCLRMYIDDAATGGTAVGL